MTNTKYINHEIAEEMKVRYKEHLDAEGELDESLLVWALLNELGSTRDSLDFWKRKHRELVSEKYETKFKIA